MVHKAIHTEAIDEGLDRQNLTQLKKRFLQINSTRLSRTRSALSDRQQQFLDILPLLFHVNHPMLPGYVSRSTPCGVCHYEPDRGTLALARSQARSFSLSADATRQRDIEGIYAMGSVGTVAHSEQSDFDIWICYKPGLGKDPVQELNRKCRRIAAWAAELRLEVHFFPMDYEAFKLGKVSALNEESSGSAQRLLLLDEFYRTALYLAGRTPLWWFIPSAVEADYQDYAHTLLHRRFLPADVVVDFGGVASIPDGEFVGAGIWQLYKAIDSPYKSVLKLLLLEAYASEYPINQPLSLTYKQMVYAGELEVDELDSYIMIYRRIEAYLRDRNQLQRLELARRALYFKINKPLSHGPTSGSKSWQRCLLERLTNEWGWTPEHLRLLDQRNRWKADQVMEERALLVNELNHSYRFLTEFAAMTGATRAISAEELTVLGRKLQAAFERRPGKIEWVNPGISSDLSEPSVALMRRSDSHGAHWSAAAPLPGVSLSTVMPPPFRQAATLTELLLWCLFNGIVQPGTRFDLSAADLSSSTLRRLLIALQRWIPRAGELPHKQFQKAAEPKKVLLLINVGTEPQPQLRELGLQRMSNRMDALRYSGFESNLVMSIDFIMCNSWQEISCTRFEGEHSLLAALKEYLSLSLPGSRHAIPELTVKCIGASHASTITQRVKEWFQDIIDCYYADDAGDCSAQEASDRSTGIATRYVFAMAGKYYSLQFRGPRLHVEPHRNEQAVLRWLGREQPRHSPFRVDRHAFARHPLPAIARDYQPGAVNVFYYNTRLGMQFYVVDEFGSLISFATPGQAGYPLTPLHRFLRAVTSRQARSAGGTGSTCTNIHFFELCRDTDKQLICQPRRIGSSPRPGTIIDVKAAVSCDDRGAYRYSFYCEQQEFTHLEYGSRLFHATASHVRSLRQADQAYPVYLSDLDLELCRTQLAREGHLQTIHYLRLKLELEQALNKALPDGVQ